jgi:hypothetical protein
LNWCHINTKINFLFTGIIIDNNKDKIIYDTLNNSMKAFVLATITFAIITLCLMNSAFDEYREAFKHSWFAIGFMSSIYLSFNDDTDLSTLIVTVCFGLVSMLSIVFMAMLERHSRKKSDR